MFIFDLLYLSFILYFFKLSSLILRNICTNTYLFTHYDAIIIIRYYFNVYYLNIPAVSFSETQNAETKIRKSKYYFS